MPRSVKHTSNMLETCKICSQNTWVCGKPCYKCHETGCCCNLDVYNFWFGLNNIDNSPHLKTYLCYKSNVNNIILDVVATKNKATVGN